VSIARKWTIQCDKCGEEKSSWLWKSEDQLVEDSRKDGWSISDRGEDLCPPCQLAAPSEPKEGHGPKCGCDMVWNCEGKDPVCFSFGHRPKDWPAAPTPSAGEEPWKCPGLASGGPGKCSREKPCFYCNPKFQAGRP
jgi:hypothetical protein